jgi:FlaA1/EpsC-like NDP-sugar epimerase
MGMESSAENNQVGRRRIQHWQVISALLVVYDAIVVNAAYFGALWLRFDCQFSRIPEIYYGSWLRFAPIYTVCCLILFTRMRLYNSVWRFASYTELIRVVIASVISAVVHTAGITLWLRRMPMTYYVFGALLQFVLVISVRFSYRLVLLLAEGRKKQPNGLPPKRVMLIGAGSAGRLILRDINAAKEVVERVVCIIDDEPNKWHRFIDGIPVVGGRETILENVEKFQIEKIYLAIPSATAAER